jgi:hypothetical protein
MDIAMASNPAARPRMLTCYLCGREFGTKRWVHDKLLSHHLLKHVVLGFQARYYQKPTPRILVGCQQRPECPARGNWTYGSVEIVELA